ncbi:MAG: hypothetical protein EA347_05540 [Thioalkalivibrio sp.]|nr:MAG: hypothetical protein EA347_05540 [Thioalkalivibrio sp.]
MSEQADDCIWVRTSVLLGTGDKPPAYVKTRKLCQDGVFLEHAGLVADQPVEVIFPEPYSDGDGHHLFGTVTRCWPDGVWVSFRNNFLSSAEMLMRAGPPLMEGAREHV